MKIWVLTGVLATAVAAVAAPLASKSEIRGLPAAAQKLLGREIAAEIAGEVAERRELVRLALEPLAEKRKKLARSLHGDSKAAKLHEAAAKIIADKGLDASAKAKALTELTDANRRTFESARGQAGITGGKLQAEVPRKLATEKAVAISTELAGYLVHLEKQKFETFPFALEWEDADPAGISASLATSTSSSGSFSTSILFQANGEAATEADPGVEFVLPASVQHFSVTAKVEVSSSAAYVNTTDDYLYGLSFAELRVMSTDYAIADGRDSEYVVSVLTNDPGETPSQTIGAKTILLESPPIATQSGAKVYALAGGGVNVIGEGSAYVSIAGKVKEITFHYLD